MARTDSERLNWIAENPGAYWSGTPRIGICLSQAIHVAEMELIPCGNGSDLRQAIDAAMDAEEADDD